MSTKLHTICYVRLRSHKTTVKMFNLAYLVVLSILLVFSVEADTGNLQTNDDFGTIVLANVIYRHGDRTPIDPYPADPYRNLSYWPTGWGQLTNTGKNQHYQLGKWFRQRYAHLLPEVYSKEDILVRSTDVDRTLMSAASNLAGLYQPVPAQVWNVDIDWQPIPVHTLPEQMDEILAAKKKCPKYEKELQEVKDSPEMRELNRRYSNLYNYLSANSGKDVHDIQGVEYIFNTLNIETLYNLTLPKWTKSVYPTKMAYLAARSFTIAALNPELQRLKSGPLLGEIVQQMSKKAVGKLSPDRKMFMYSGHDTTVANMLMTLGVFDPHTPPYTAAIMIELRKNLDDEYMVTVWYRNDSSQDPMLLTIPGCTQVCSLALFVKLTKPVVPVNWETECQLHRNLAESVYPTSFCNKMVLAELAGVTTVGVAMLMLLVVVCIQWRRDTSSYIYHRLPATNSVA